MAAITTAEAFHWLHFESGEPRCGASSTTGTDDGPEVMAHPDCCPACIDKLLSAAMQQQMEF